MKTKLSRSRQHRSISAVSFLFIATTTEYRTVTTTTAFVIRQNDLLPSIVSTNLFMGKNSDRAHIERHLEEMMGDDWREFRARLVARERAEAKSDTANGIKRESVVADRKELLDDHQKTLNKQGQLGDLFAGAIHSIFNTNPNSSNNNDKKKVAAAAAKSVKSDRKREGGSSGNIFDGDTIGGAEVSRTTSSSSSSSYLDYAAEALHETSSSVEDPFLSAEEVPCHLRPIQTSINKHRWAHDIAHVENGCVLIANEKLGGVFHQTVVLIVQHNDHVGSIGIVINRPYEGDLLKIASEKESKLDLSLKLAFTTSPVTYGGPVLTDEYSIIHGFGEVEGSTKLCPGVYVGGSEELMNEVRSGRLDPKHTLFAKGHAAWTPKQLQREISKGVWYVAAASSDLILRYAGAPITDDDNTHDLWADILTCMGGKHSEIAASYSSRGDVRLP